MPARNPPRKSAAKGSPWSGLARALAGRNVVDVGRLPSAPDLAERLKARMVAVVARGEDVYHPLRRRTPGLISVWKARQLVGGRVRRDAWSALTDALLGDGKLLEVWLEPVTPGATPAHKLVLPGYAGPFPTPVARARGLADVIRAQPWAPEGVLGRPSV